MSEIVLSADTTRKTGTRPSRRLRREQRVPAVVYGLSQEAVSIDVAWVDLREALSRRYGLVVVHRELERRAGLSGEYRQLLEPELGPPEE